LYIYKANYHAPYNLHVSETPVPQMFRIIIGDTISNNVPGTGAGNIEQPGNYGSYRITFVPGQHDTFDWSSDDLSDFGCDFGNPNRRFARIANLCYSVSLYKRKNTRYKNGLETLRVRLPDRTTS
jgi:hypothetical protein